jgi:hypothetical protein
MIESNSAGHSQEGKIGLEYELCDPGRTGAVTKGVMKED